MIRKSATQLLMALGVLSCAILQGQDARADGIISQVVSAPIFANGILRDERSGINIYLQNDRHQGLNFMDPQVLGYGIPPGGTMEVEMVSGFQRDPSIPLDDKSILLTVGAPQQGLPDDATGHSIAEGANPNTFVISPKGADGLLPDNLVSPAPGAGKDPIRQKGIKIVHVGRVSAFVSRGERGTVEVRIKDRSGNVVARGQASVRFQTQPTAQVFLTNIPHGQRNHNWQRLKPGQVVGAQNGTLPLPVLLFARNKGLGKVGLNGAGVLSRQQLSAIKFAMPLSIGEDFAALILQDTNDDGKLDPEKDEIIGMVREVVPEGAKGQQLVTPIVNDALFLSIETAKFNARAGKAIGGSIMQTVYVTGNRQGLYRLIFELFSTPGDMTSDKTPPAIYTVVVE